MERARRVLLHEPAVRARRHARGVIEVHPLRLRDQRREAHADEVDDGERDERRAGAVLELQGSERERADDGAGLARGGRDAVERRAELGREDLGRDDEGRGVGSWEGEGGRKKKKKEEREGEKK